MGIPYKLKDYIELVDWTGRVIRDDKPGYIENSLPKTLDRLSLDANSWKALTTEFEDHFQSWIRSEHIAKTMKKSLGSKLSTPNHYSLE